MPRTTKDDEVVIGDECHIISQKRGGPRWDASFPKDLFDTYYNLIILCKVHHKVIDDQPLSYPSEGLRKLKAMHEKWVNSNLQEVMKEHNEEEYKKAARILYGKDLIRIVADAHFYNFDYDEPEDQEEIEIISVFLQYAQDYGDLGDILESGQLLEVGVELTSQIRDLEKFDYLVFGLREQRKYKLANKVSLWDVAVLRILKKTNPLITANRSLLG